jgi:hypothetical protein
MMGLFLAFAIGYVIGARAGSKDLDEVVQSLKAIGRSDELADVVSAVRSHVSHTLHEFATMVDSEGARPGETGDLVEHVRKMFGQG